MVAVIPFQKWTPSTLYVEAIIHNVIVFGDNSFVKGIKDK